MGKVVKRRLEKRSRSKRNNEFVVRNKELFTAYLAAKEINDQVGVTRIRNEIIKTNWAVVEVMVTKWWNRHGFRCKHLTIEDMKQSTFFDVCKAVEKYDPNKGYTFSTYLYWWVLHALQRTAVFDDVVRVSFHKTMTNKLVYLDTMEPAVQDYVANINGGIESADMAYDEMTREELGKSIMSELPNYFSSRVVRILEGYARGETLVEMGKVLNISRERVRQLKEEGLNYLREVYGDVKTMEA